MPNRIALHEALDITPAGGDPIELLPAEPHGAEAPRPASPLPAPAGYVIEIDEEAVGLVTVHPEGMAFHAVHMRAQGLDGQVFTDAAAARTAAESAFYGRD
jgi:hypothetical protein